MMPCTVAAGCSCKSLILNDIGGDSIAGVHVGFICFDKVDWGVRGDAGGDFMVVLDF